MEWEGMRKQKGISNIKLNISVKNIRRNTIKIQCARNVWSLWCRITEKGNDVPTERRRYKFTAPLRLLYMRWCPFFISYSMSFKCGHFFLIYSHACIRGIFDIMNLFCGTINGITFFVIQTDFHEIKLRENIYFSGRGFKCAKHKIRKMHTMNLLWINLLIHWTN